MQEMRDGRDQKGQTFWGIGQHFWGKAVLLSAGRERAEDMPPIGSRGICFWRTPTPGFDGTINGAFSPRR